MFVRYWNFENTITIFHLDVLIETQGAFNCHITIKYVI